MEVLGKIFAIDVFDNNSAGTELVDHINHDAVRLMKNYMELIWNRHSAIN
jgi:hypothetical protein